MRWLLALLMTVLFSAPLVAHQQKAAFSTIEHNPRSGMLEVVHYVPLHDAEHALRRQGGKSADIVANIESRRAFSQYVAERFSIEKDGAPVALAHLGNEVDGGNLVIYFEGRSPGQGSALTVQSQILTDIWDRQVNRVNIGSGTQPTTLIFKAGDRPQQAQLR